MPEVASDRVAFPLRAGTDEELGKLTSNAHARKWRYQVLRAPELCVTHGAASTWSKKHRIISRVDLEFYRRSRRSRIIHDIFSPTDRMTRVVERPWKGFSTTVIAHGCGQCRRWFRLRQARTAALFITALCMFTAVPFIAAGVGHEALGGLSALASLPVLVVACMSWRWVHDLAKAFVSYDGTQLVIRDAHPDYVREAVALGAEASRTSA